MSVINIKKMVLGILQAIDEFENFPIRSKGLTPVFEWVSEIKEQVESIEETLEWMEEEGLSWSEAWDESDICPEEFYDFVDTMGFGVHSFLEDCLFDFGEELGEPLLTDFVENAAIYTQGVIENISFLINELAERLLDMHQRFGGY